MRDDNSFGNDFPDADPFCRPSAFRETSEEELRRKRMFVNQQRLDDALCAPDAPAKPGAELSLSTPASRRELLQQAAQKRAEAQEAYNRHAVKQDRANHLARFFAGTLLAAWLLVIAYYGVPFAITHLLHFLHITR